MKKLVLILAVINLAGCSESPRQVVASAQRAVGLPGASAASTPGDPNAEYMRCSVTLHRIAAIVGQDAINVEFDPKYVERDGYEAGCTWFIRTPDQFGKMVGGCGMDVESAARMWLADYKDVKYAAEHPKPPEGKQGSGFTAKVGACGTTVIVKAGAQPEALTLPDSEKPEKKLP